MNFLIIGDVVGKSGVEKLQKELPNLIKKNNIDFCIVNGENSANGKGLRKQEYYKIKACGADVITMGNHVYYRKEMASEYINFKDLLIPANITNLNGNNNVVKEKNDKKIGVINLIGKAEMGDILEKNTSDPFKCILSQIEEVKKAGADYIFIDFHAEATAEKIAMGYFLDGKVTCVFGTHTHVATADETILSNGTAYITDIGMTGPKDSVIGLKKEVALKRFVEGAYAKYECSQNEAFLNGLIVKTDDLTHMPVSIDRINM